MQDIREKLGGLTVVRTRGNGGDRLGRGPSEASRGAEEASVDGLETKRGDVLFVPIAFLDGE